MNRETVIIAGISVFSTTVGVAAGAYLTKRRLMVTFDERLENEIQEAREFFTIRAYKKDLTPEMAVEQLVPVAERPISASATDAASAMRSYQGEQVQVVTSTEGLSKIADEEVPEHNNPTPGEAVVTVEETTTKVSNIFVDNVPLTDEDFDMEEERLARRNGVPYVVTREEYDENADQFEQQALTYFAFDDVLVDEDEKSIDNIEEFVGKHNLQRFGHGSGDAKVVYIRNELKEMDFEVLRSDGSYAEEVLGLTSDDSHLEHSAMSRRGRRHFDE
jgi:hypothetical protein